MSLTSYRAAPPRVRVFWIVWQGLDLDFLFSALWGGEPESTSPEVLSDILLADLAATYSPAP